MSENSRIPDPQDDIRVADAVAQNWVDRYAPQWSRPYLRLSRADRPVGTWLLLIPCWWGLLLAILGDPAGPALGDIWIGAGCAAGAFLMRGAGCTWNDITDRDIDDKVARTRSRPIPSGQVSVRQAIVWMSAQALVALGVLLTFNAFTIVRTVAGGGLSLRQTLYLVAAGVPGHRVQLGCAAGMGGSQRRSVGGTGSAIPVRHGLDAVL